MKVLKVMGLGLGIWGLALLWPDINRLLTGPVMLLLVLTLSTLKLIFVLGRSVGHQQNNKPKGRVQDHPSHPIPVIFLPH